MSDEMPMNCRELFERLSEYVDGELSQELCQEIRKHLDGCDPCVNFAKTLKTTADLCRRLPSKPIPPEVAADLRSFLTSHIRRQRAMRSRVWVLAAIGVFLSACAADGMGAATAPGYPPAVYNQRVSTEEVSIYWACTRSADQVQVEGVVQNTRGGQVNFMELELGGADAHDRYLSGATTALKDIVLQSNQVSPFTIQLRPSGGESRFDLFYKYQVDVAFGKSPQERFMVRDVCSPNQHRIQR